MGTVRDFLEMASDDYYEVEFYNVNTGDSQVMEIREAYDHDEIVDAEMQSWDLGNGGLCINYSSDDELE